MQNESLFVLRGKTIVKIKGAKRRSDEIRFHFSDGSVGKFYHQQECCEGVAVEDICGDIEDLIGSPLLMAEEASNVDETGNYESATWTFYKFATKNGSVTIRWLGESNGYYSKGVSFELESPTKSKK